MRKPTSKLSEREKIVYNYLITNKANMLSIPIDNICKELKVGYATIYSLIKKLGFTKYRELVLHIYTEALNHEQDEHYNLQSNYNALIDINFDKQNQEKIIQIVKLIKTKKQIYLLGKSNSNIIAQKYAFDLCRLGIKAYALSNDYDSLIMQSSLLSKDDLLIVVTNSGTTDFVVDAVKIIKNNNVKIIVICANNSKWLEENSDIFYRIYNRTYINAKGRVSNFIPFIIFLDSLWEEFNIQYN